MAKKIKTVLFGLGAMGTSIARFALCKKGIQIIGAVDIAKEKVGKDLGDVLGIGKKVGVTVTDNPKGLFSEIKGDIVVHATASHLSVTYPQVVKCIKAEMNVVSTCEELSYPYHKHPKLANKIHELAKKHGVTVLATGINPGYLMDTLPIVLTGMCQQVKRIKVTRMMYSGNRRMTYQKKIGTGMTPVEFGRTIREGKITGHVGLEESIAMISTALGWKLDQIQVLPPEPVVSDAPVQTWSDGAQQEPFIFVEKGQVCGLTSVAYGRKAKDTVIELEFISHANVKEPYDEVIIEGIPNIYERIKGGVNGDVGTVAVVVNAIPRVVDAKPGLMTMKDVSPLSCMTEGISA